MTATGTTTPNRALLIEDDQSVREAVTSAFRDLGFAVRAEPTGLGLARMVEAFRPDVAILDITLPSGPDGFELAKQVIALAGIPVVFLTAADALEDRLAGFEAGGDDYVVKPFAMSELLARVRAVLRRSGRLQSAVIEIRDLLIDDNAKEVVRAGQVLDLTPTEFELLMVLARTPTRCSRKASFSPRCGDSIRTTPT